MGAYSIDVLMRKWSRGEVAVEQVTGTFTATSLRTGSRSAQSVSLDSLFVSAGHLSH